MYKHVNQAKIFECSLCGKELSPPHCCLYALCEECLGRQGFKVEPHQEFPTAIFPECSNCHRSYEFEHRFTRKKAMFCRVQDGRTPFKKPICGETKQTCEYENWRVPK